MSRAVRAALLVAGLLILGLAGLARGEIVQRFHLRMKFEGDLTPKALPRAGQAPVHVSVAAEISSTNSKTPPQLRQMSIAINRYGRFDSTGLPLCTLSKIQPSTTADALAACRSSLVGEGQFSAEVLIRGQAPFPSDGKVYAFNGRVHGKPAILAHVYGTDPAPTSYTLPFIISRSKGTFGTTLTASLPDVTANSGYITGLSLNLGKTYRSRGKAHSYLSASCPAPGGLSGASFPFAKASFSFAGGKTLRSTLIRNCKVRR